ncbi:MAG: cadherin-like domain-containing protein [Actinomycetota bacterium]|nr:cadherin-like domain-containing protein [Actinomycetota bacterium]
MSKSETPPAGTVTAGQATPVTYQLTVANSGGADSGAVTVTDAIPVGTTYVPGSATCGTTPNCSVAFAAGTVTWTLTSVAGTSSNNLSFQVTVDAADANGSTISNTANFTNVNTPGCGANPTCPTTTVTNPVVTPASVTVSKSGPSGNVTASVTTITYQLTVANSGGAPSGPVTITDAVPAGTTYVANSASCGTTLNCSVAFATNTVTWTLTSVAALSSSNLTFQTKVDASDPEGSSVSNSATFTNVMTPNCTTATCASNPVTNTVVIPPPTVVAQSFTGAVGNTTFGVGTTPPEPSVKLSSPPNLLTGDSDPTNHPLAVTVGTFPTTQGGSVVVNADGTFTYNPPAGFTGGNDTFMYTVSNGFHSASNTVTVAVANRVWYVNSALGTNGNGTSISPFNTLSSVTGPGGPTGSGDYIFLFGSASNYTGGIALKANQTFLGQSVGLVIGGHTIVTASGVNPTITNSSGSPALTLAENDTIRGVNVNATSGPGVSASGVDATTIESTVAIVSTNGDGLDVNGGNGAFSVAAPITTSGTGHSVSVANRSGGTVTLSGAVNDNGTGVVLSGNSGAAINFTGGVVVASGANPAFTATGGGMVTVAGSANSLTTTTATALNVVNTTIGGGSGLTFKSISAGTGGGGPASGIVLNNTGGSGGLTVTGTAGTADSGGVIQHTSGPGILLISTTSPSFAWMNIHDTGGSGVRGGAGNGAGDTPGNVTNFSFTDGTINNSGTALGIDDSNIGFNTTGVGTEQNLTGTVVITGNTLTNAYYHGVDIFNYNGTIDNATISNNTITSSTVVGNSKGSGIRLIAFGGSTTVASITKATLDRNTITNFPSAVGLQVQCGNANSAVAAPSTCGTPGSATNIINVTNNAIHGASAATRIGAEGMVVLVNGRGQGNFNISGNDIRNTTGQAISHSAFGFAVVTSTISNNTIVANNGFGSPGIGVGTSRAFSSADTPSLTTTISGNNISQTDGNGILAVARDATGTLRVKIQNNTVAAPLGGVRPGIRVDSGNSASGNETVCLNISGNTSAPTAGTAAKGIGLRKQGTNPAVNTFGINGMSATATPAVEAYVDSLNPTGGGTFLISATNGFTNCSLP